MVDGGAMVRGKAAVRVRLPINPAPGATQPQYDLTPYETFADPTCGTNGGFGDYGTVLQGCRALTFLYDAPTDSTVPLLPLKIPEDYLSRTNRVFLGADPNAQKAYDNNLKDLPGGVARFVIGFIPVVGDAVDGLEQLYNAAVGKDVDVVLAVLSAAGLALDIGAVGADLTAPLKGAYRVSQIIAKEGGGLVAQFIKAEMAKLTRGRVSPRRLIDTLRARLAKGVELARAPGCRFGTLGLGCVIQYDKTATAVRAREGLQADAALNKVDVNVNRAQQSNISPSCYLGAVNLGAQVLSLDDIAIWVLGIPVAQASPQMTAVAATSVCDYAKFRGDISRQFRAKYLAKGIKQEDIDKLAPHHIVNRNANLTRNPTCRSLTDNSTDVCTGARNILAKAGIDIDDPWNGVLLAWRKGQTPSFDAVYGSAKEHQSLHTRQLYTRVFDELEALERGLGPNPNPTILKRAVRNKLQEIAQELLDGVFP